MNFSKIQDLTKTKVVLVAPLDWGLGHTTRCIPIIKALVNLDCTVIVAVNNTQKKIISETFPNLKIEYLKGYSIKYSRRKSLFFFTLLKQLPKIFRIYYQEHRWLKKVVADNKIDVVISDNRFGLYHPGIKTVYITHQVNIKTGLAVLDGLASRLHRNIIKKFNRLWIPDFEAERESLAGDLSHLKMLPDNAVYIGGLSRFEATAPQQKIYKIVAVISGPEPQRTFFERFLLDSFVGVEGKILLVRGLPAETVSLPNHQHPQLIVKNHLNATELNEAMMQAEIVLCRSGYTTVMDLVKIQQKAILIPTPGQAEQEYLAKYLLNKEVFLSFTQDKFSLEKALQAAESFPYNFPKAEMNLYEDAVAELVQSI